MKQNAAFPESYVKPATLHASVLWFLGENGMGIMWAWRSMLRAMFALQLIDWKG